MRLTNTGWLYLDSGIAYNDSEYIKLTNADNDGQPIMQLNSSQEIDLYAGNSSGIILGSNIFGPWVTYSGAIVCGNTNRRWAHVYTNGLTNYSDRRAKNSIHNLQENPIYEDLFYGLNPVTYYLNDENNKPNFHKRHIGFIAQEVESLCDEIGLDLDDLFIPYGKRPCYKSDGLYYKKIS